MAHIRKTRRSPLAFLTEFEDQQDTTLVIPEDLSALSDEELAALSEQATSAFNDLYQGGEAQLSEEDLNTLSSLADGIEALNTETTSRETAAAARAADAAALAARVNPTAEAEDDAADESEGDESEAEEPETPAEVEEPETEVEEPEALAASGRRETRVNLANLRSRQTSRPPVTPARRTMRDLVLAAPDVPGFSNGQGMDFIDMGRAVDSRLSTFNKSAYEAAAAQGRHIRQQFGIAAIQKPYDDGLTIDSNDIDHIEEVFARAVDESRLPQGSLVASGGWCAPSEILYDLFEMESSDGLFSLPEVNIARGGIRWTPGPDFGTIFAETGFSYTEQEDIDGDYDGEGGGSKPCFRVDCPDFDEARLNLDGLCITAGLLQQRGYPEVIARTVRGALIAHGHRMSANKINGVVAGSTHITMPADQVGATAPVLTAIELQVEHYRNRARMSRATSLEAVFPFWVRGLIRSDLSRRLGTDLDPLQVTDAMITGWFALRGVNAQFVYNWQDVASTAASGFTAWPTEIDFLLYAAGTWVGGGGSVITMDTIYDSTLLGHNDYTALFTEEGWLTAKRGHDSRRVTVPVCPTGDTGGGVLINCDGSAGA